MQAVLISDLRNDQSLPHMGFHGWRYEVRMESFADLPLQPGKHLRDYYCYYLRIADPSTASAKLKLDYDFQSILVRC